MRKLSTLVVTALVAIGACSSDTPAAVPVATAPTVGPPGSLTSQPTDAAPASAPASAPLNTVADTVADIVPGTPAPKPPADDVYTASPSWICRADIDDVCDKEYPLATVDASGTPIVQPYSIANDPAVDCFYVYPTISGDAGVSSDMTADSEIGATAFQAARFNQVCNVYAPVYRSVTLSGLFTAPAAERTAAWDQAYGDVLAAWRHYLKYDNHGRPVVLLSHSQGSFHVTRLVREEIDPNADQRKLIVSAMLAGTSFQVAPGKDVGGDAQNMPLCRAVDQFGCIITYQSFRDTVPPQPGAFFGAPGANTESSCTNPAALGGGPGILKSAMGAGDWAFADKEAVASLSVSFVDTPGLITAECKVLNGYSYLAISVNADAADGRGDTIPGDGSPNWGLHTVDINLAQESLIELVRTQSKAYLQGR